MILRYDQGMNTHPETPAPTDPADLAREVLAAEKVMDGTPGLLYLDGPTHEHEEAAGAILAAAPDLARTVIDLTATIKRVEALADDMDHDAGGGAVGHAVDGGGLFHGVLRQVVGRFFGARRQGGRGDARQVRRQVVVGGHRGSPFRAVRRRVASSRWVAAIRWSLRSSV